MDTYLSTETDVQQLSNTLTSEYKINKNIYIYET